MLESIRHDYDKDRLKFDPTKWSRLGRKACTLRECAGEWQTIVEKTCSRVYAKHVEFFFRLHINPAMGDLDVREITPDDIERFHLSLLEKGYQPKTVRTIMTTLKILFRRIHEKMRLIDIVPSFPTIRVPKKIRGWIDRDVQNAVLRFMPERTHLLMEIMFETGIRPGEAVALRVKSLVDGGVYVDAAMGSDGKLKQTKTGHEEHYPLSPSLFARVKQHAEGKLPEAFLFTRAAGQPWTVNKLSDQWGKAAKKAGVNMPMYVAVRHSKVSKFYKEQKGVFQETVRQQLGHTDFKTTKIHYLQPPKSEIRVGSDN